jgi:uncharacterized protein (TIGR02391 family)
MPVIPQPHRLSLHDAINYAAERCKCETEKAGKAVHAALGQGALVASANIHVSDRSYMPGIIAGPLPVGPPHRVDAGIGQVPSELWAETPWPDFLRRAVLPFGNPMFKGQPGTPVYSDPTIATADIDAWLSHEGNQDDRAVRAYRDLDLHPVIGEAASKLYLDGHYASAIEDAVKALNNLVRGRSGKELDGDNLMTTVFSPNNPILQFNDLKDQSDRDEQKGFMMMFAGAVAGLRNPRAHKLIKDDPERALEFIAFVSLLAKLLDGVKKKE